jgi:hypothetical protein
VAHTIPEHPLCYRGTGMVATQALYGFLAQRLRLSVIPTGVGVTTAAVAADEGQRAMARSVVMARLASVEYVSGLSLRLRLEVVVVREGRVVLRRTVDAPPAPLERRRGDPDPVFGAVSRALDLIGADLASAL